MTMNSSRKSSVQARRIQAIELTVTNLDRSIDFYTKALHFEVISDVTVIEKDVNIWTENELTKVQVVTLKLGDENIRLMQYLDNPGEPISSDSQSNDLWFQHLAIVVRDMDAAYAHLQSFPFEAISTAPQMIPPGNKEAAYIQAFKFRDPDCHPLELICFPPDKGQKKWHQPTDRLFLGIDHTAIAIANTEQSLQFYRDQLGMQVDGGSFNWRETQARMDGLPNAQVRITALRPAQGGLGIELLEYVEPANGRSISACLKPNDVAYVQVELIANLTAGDVFDHPVQYISQDLNLTQNNSLLNHPAYRIKDPTGHSLLVIPNQEGVLTGAIATFPNVVEQYDERMSELIHPEASLQKLAGDAVHSEGPVYFPEDDSIVWSDAHDNRLLRWSAKDGVTVLRDPSDYQNGNYRDLEGRIVACSGGLRAIIRQEPDGQWRVLCDRYQGKRLNSPNDLVVKSDSTIWFTDPPYGITEPNQGYGGEQEQPGSYVYRFDPTTGEIDAVITDMLRPNGLAFSPDEQLLYVSDSSAFNLPDGYHHVRVYDVVAGQSVTNGRVFAEINPGQPDGLRVDRQGNVWISSEDSVQVYAADRTCLGKILVPETVANLTFGGQKGDRLIIAAGHSLYAIQLNTQSVLL